MTPKQLYVYWVKNVEYPAMLRELKFLKSLSSPSKSKTIKVRLPLRSQNLQKSNA